MHAGYDRGTRDSGNGFASHDRHPAAGTYRNPPVVGFVRNCVSLLGLPETLKIMEFIIFSVQVSRGWSNGFVFGPKGKPYITSVPMDAIEVIQDVYCWRSGRYRYPAGTRER